MNKQQARKEVIDMLKKESKEFKKVSSGTYDDLLDNFINDLESLNGSNKIPFKGKDYFI